MRRTTYLLIILLYTLGVSAQSQIDAILSEIETNNTTLVALRQQAQADKTGSRTGIYLPNPEVEFNYLWGNSSEAGKRTEFNIMQSFDFPTAYAYKRKIADGKVKQADIQYDMQRKALLLQVRNVCIDLIYRNALGAELTIRLQHAQTIASAYQAKFDKGEANILENNKAELNLLNAQKEVENNQIEKEALLSELARFNAGKSLILSDTGYEDYLLPLDFEQWFVQAESKSPSLQLLSNEVELSQKQEKLNKAMGLPKLAVGYRSEYILGTNLQGFGAGFSIPLWENKNKIKHAKAQTLALQNSQSDARMQFYNMLNIQYKKVQKLQLMVRDYHKV